MNGIDWAGLLLGAVAGAAVGAIYFAGLAAGIRLALRASRPAAVLLVSAALRIALVLACGWLVAQAGVAALAGYALSFLLARVIAVALARRKPEAPSWN